MTTVRQDDDRWMLRAIELAQRGVGCTAPNPPVGAVIVKEGREIGCGWHRRAGLPHAEREAMAAARAAGHDLVGATAYVTLEPCSTHGRTPPCVDGLIEAGISRVVYACEDRNPAHRGAAKARLQSAGMAVTAGVLHDKALPLVRPFFKVQEQGLPWVMVKMAMSLDGCITRPAGEGAWLTGAAALADVQRLRAQTDLILTSGETVRRDRPRLTIRDLALLNGRAEGCEQPWRLIVTHQVASLPRDAPLLSDEWRQRTLVRGGNCREILREMAQHHAVNHVMVEAGGKLVAALLEQDLVDEIVIYLAPLVCGTAQRATAGLGTAGLSLDSIEWQQLGADLRCRALLNRSATVTSAV